MTKEDFIKKHRRGNIMLVHDFESDLDELLREHAIKFLIDNGVKYSERTNKLIRPARPLITVWYYRWLEGLTSPNTK